MDQLNQAAKQLIELRPTEKQHLAWTALQSRTEAKYIVFGGGAGGGKSWHGCEWLLTNCYLYPGSKWFIGRNELKRLMSTTYVTWLKVCAFHKIPREHWKLNGQYNYIEFIAGEAKGSRIDLLDVKFIPSDPLYERFGSSEYTGGWLEEAGEIHFLAFDVLKTRVGRHMNKEFDVPSKILITCNPKKNWLYQVVYKPWKEGTLPAEFVFIQSLYGDNPHTAEEYGKNLSLITDPAMKQRLMLGNWEYDDDPNTLISFDAIIDMFTNAADRGNKYITGDIARYGQDKTVIYLWDGFMVTDKKVMPLSGIDQISTELRTMMEIHQVPRSRVVVDEDGVGGGVVDTLRGIKGFVNGSSPLPNPKNGYEKQNFRNLKAQCYYMLADHINDRRIGFTPRDEDLRKKLIEELEQVKSKDAGTDGKLELVSKDEVREALGRSPDYSDALMMRMYFELIPGGTTATPGRVNQSVPANLNRHPGVRYNLPT